MNTEKYAKPRLLRETPTLTDHNAAAAPATTPKAATAQGARLGREAAPLLKFDGAAPAEELLPEAAAAPVLLAAADPELETVTPKPVDVPAAVPDAPVLDVAGTVRVAEPLLYYRSEQNNVSGQDAACTYAEALADPEVEAADEWLEESGGPWIVKLGVSSNTWPAFLEIERCSTQQR